MNRRIRRIFAVLTLCAAVSLSFGVSGYSSVSAERGVSVTVVEPEEAYLAFGDSLQCGMGGGTGDNNEFIHNQFGSNTTIEHIRVTVTAIGGYIRVGTGGRATNLSEGESTELTFSGQYEPGESASIQVKPPGGNVTAADELAVELLEATGEGVRVTDTQQTYDVFCSN